MFKFAHPIVFLFLVFTLTTHQSVAQNIAIRTVALSGDQDLVTGDPVIGVGSPVANDSSGKVMFFVTTELAGNRQNMLALSDGTSASVLVDFDFLDASKPKPILNESGIIAFPWFEGTEDGSRNGVFIGSSLGTLGFIDAESLALPGNEDRVFVVAGRLTINKSGIVVFATGFTSAGNTPTEPTNGIFFGSGPGTMFRIILASEQAPGTADGTTFQSVDRPLINDRGDVAFFGRLTLAAIEAETERETGIWVSSSQTGKVELVARAGETLLPGMEAGSNFTGISGDMFAIDPNGAVLFEATFQPPGQVPKKEMWRGSSPATLEPLFGVTRQSDLGFDVETKVENDVVITDAGNLVYTSSSLRVVNGVILNDTRVEDAIWRDAGPILEAVVHTGVGIDQPGSDAPGTGGTFSSIAEFTANGPGRVAFVARPEVAGTLQGRGLWAEDSEGVIRLVTRIGDQIATRDGPKTVSGLALLAGPGNVSGFSSSYNSRFELAFWASFEDASSGVFKAIVDEDVPEPTIDSEFIWSGSCRDTNWHSGCPDTNWVDATGTPHLSPPGDLGTEKVTITNSQVTITDAMANIGILQSSGGLEVNQDLTIDGESFVDPLNLQSGTLTSKQGLALHGTSMWQGGSINSSTEGLIINEENLDIVAMGDAASTKKLLGTLGLSNKGTVTQTDSFDMSGSRIENQKGATWSLFEAGILTASSRGTFVNFGALLLPDEPMLGPEPASIEAFFEAREGSVIDIVKSTLELKGGADFLGDSIIANPQGNFPGSSSLLKMGSSGGEQRYRVSSGIVVTLLMDSRLEDNAVLNLEAGAEFRLAVMSNLFLAGGTVVGQGSLVSEGATATITWIDGDIGTDVIAPAPVTVVLRSSVFEVSGRDLKMRGTLRVERTGRLKDNGVSRLDFGGVTFTPSMELAGGQIDLAAGSLEVLGRGRIESSAGGSVVIRRFAALVLGENDNGTQDSANTQSLRIDARFDNKGTVRINNGSLSIIGDVAQISQNRLDAGAWIVEGTNNPKISIFEANGSTPIEKVTTIGNEAIVVLGEGGSLPWLGVERNSGTFEIGKDQVFKTDDLANNGRLRVRDGASLEVVRVFKNDMSMRIDTGAKVEAGDRFETGPGSKSTINGEITVLPAGGSPVDDRFVVNGGRFLGSGIINGKSFDNNGILKPGSSPGVMTINADFVQSPEGSLEIEIGGTGVGINQDQLVINGDASIAGSLALKFIDDFSPRAGQTFDFLSVSGTQTGDFDSVEIVGLAEGFEFDVTPTDTGFMMTALSDGVFTGIPGEINDITIGFDSPETETMAASGDMNVPMLQFDVVPEADGLLINSLTLSASGSGDDVLDLAEVTVWVDENGNGAVDFEESSIGTGVYSADNGTLNLSIDPPLEVAARETVTLLVTYNMAVAEEEEVAAEAKAVFGAQAMNVKHEASSLRLPVALAALTLPFILGIGLVTWRKPKTHAWFGLTLAMMVCVTGCLGPDPTPGPTPGMDPTPVTFQVTLTAVGADEAGTGIDASVEDLSLAGTTLTVLR